MKDVIERKIEKRGLEPVKVEKTCNHPEHNPPMYLYIPYGQTYRHICPNCGFEVVMHSSAPMYSV